jgi:hypothetical protein
MARAIDWALEREQEQGGAFLTVNVGAESWNFQMRELAQAVVDAVDGAELELSPDSQPDRRSYKVGFARFESLAPAHQPQVSLEETIHELVAALRQIRFSDTNFRRSSTYVRLNLLNTLRRQGLLSEDLRWADAARPTAVDA